MDANERENEELLVLGIKKYPPLHMVGLAVPVRPWNILFQVLRRKREAPIAGSS
jgi:hypothetical protein